MACSVIALGDGTRAIVCGGKTPRRKCRCGEYATLLCDYALHKTKSCDAPLCPRCAVHVGEDRDYCRHHPPLAQQELPL